MGTAGPADGGVGGQSGGERAADSSAEEVRAAYHSSACCQHDDHARASDTVRHHTTFSTPSRSGHPLGACERLKL